MSKREIQIGAVAALSLAAGLGTWLGVRGGGSSLNATGSSAVAVSPAGLGALATAVRHPVFWLGSEPGSTYELTALASGRIYVRYIPAGVAVGTRKQYLTVATYPLGDAYTSLQRAAATKGAVSLRVAHAGLAVLDAAYPRSVHVAYPGVGYQVEVFDPTPRRALALVSSGKLGFFGTLAPADAPAAASVADLKTLARSLGHPIYWAGAKRGYTYELTRTSNGDVYVRYLPSGVEVGSATKQLTVVTYPYPHALDALARSAGQVLHLSGGGLAVVDSAYPESVHLAYPRASYQVEVYDANPAVARQLALTGRVQPVG